MHTHTSWYITCSWASSATDRRLPYSHVLMLFPISACTHVRRVYTRRYPLTHWHCTRTHTCMHMTLELTRN